MGGSFIIYACSHMIEFKTREGMMRGKKTNKKKKRKERTQLFCDERINHILTREADLPSLSARSARLLSLSFLLPTRSSSSLSSPPLSPRLRLLRRGESTTSPPPAPPPPPRVGDVAVLSLSPFDLRFSPASLTFSKLPCNLREKEAIQITVNELWNVLFLFFFFSLRTQFIFI